MELSVFWQMKVSCCLLGEGIVAENILVSEQNWKTTKQFFLPAKSMKKNFLMLPFKPQTFWTKNLFFCCVSPEKHHVRFRIHITIHWAVYVIKEKKSFFLWTMICCFVFLSVSLRSLHQSLLGRLDMSLQWPCVLKTSTTFKISWYLLNYSNHWFDLLHDQGLGWL